MQMFQKHKDKAFILLSVAVLLLLFALDLTTGSAEISPGDIIRTYAGGDVPPQTRSIVLEIRTVRAVTALLAGIAVSVCGLIMQTFFRNPLAGPFVLGINSGASLGAALFVLGLPAAGIGNGLAGNLGLAGAAWIGAGAVMFLVAAVSHRMKDIMVVLILGMMFSSGIDALVQVMQFFSDSTSLKSYVLWTMGSLGSVSHSQLPLLAGAVLVGLLLAVISVKPLNMLHLGEEYAVTMGLNVRRTRYVIYSATVLLAGTVTAFCGPIGFIGLASPHIARFMTGRSDHRILLPCTALAGAVLMLLCDILSRLCSLPVNVMTSLLGIPIVIWIVLRIKKPF